MKSVEMKQKNKKPVVLQNIEQSVDPLKTEA